ncbi:MAG: hypothetical protein R6X17_11765 [Candidatus Competibacteraceae bacterium]
MSPIEAAMARAIARYLATVSIPQALAALDTLWDFDPDFGGDPGRFAVIHRWRKELASDGADAFAPEVVLGALCALCEGTVLRIPEARVAPPDQCSMKEESLRLIGATIVLGLELAEMIDEATGARIVVQFRAFANANSRGA